MRRFAEPDSVVTDEMKEKGSLIVFVCFVVMFACVAGSLLFVCYCWLRNECDPEDDDVEAVSIRGRT
jgi:hypothetical protein